MLTKVTIAGLGPHADTALELGGKGGTRIAAPSEYGKTTLIDAVCWALWGVTSDGKKLDASSFRDGVQAIEVGLTLVNGTTITRRQLRGGRITRTRNGTAYGTEDSWRGELGQLGARADLCRATLAPLVWCALAQGPGGGRPLRDLLASILPGQSIRDTVREIMGGDLHDSESVTEADAFARRADANAARDRAQGLLDGARAEADRTAGAVVEPEGAPNLAAARRALLLRDRWRAYGPVADHRARVAALGPRPDDTERQVKISAARAARDAAMTERQRHSSPVPPADPGKVRTLEERQRALAVADTCPECGQPLPDHAAALERVQAELVAARELYATEAAAAQVAELARKNAAHDALERVQATDRALQQLLATPDAAQQWDRDLLAIGRQPAQVAMPTESEPTADEVAAAESVLAIAAEMAGARRQAEQARNDARARLASIEAEFSTQQRTAERLERLVDAIRRAPGELAKRQAAALGDTGPVTIEFPEDAAIRVLIDGRPWYRASRGRLVVADLYLRIALRRALNLGWLPIFVDNIQDWTGPAPENPGAHVLLETRPGEMSVTLSP